MGLWGHARLHLQDKMALRKSGVPRLDIKSQGLPANPQTKMDPHVAPLKHTTVVFIRKALF